MKVKELRELLINLDDDVEIIIGTDATNDEYSPLDSIDINIKYVADGTYSGIAYNTKHEDPDEYYDPDLYYAALEYGCDAIVLYSVN